jgi:hypothetical protein
MRRTLGWAGALLVLAAFLFPVLAADKKDGEKMPADKKEATDKMVTAGELTGKVLNVEAAKKSFALQVTVRYGVPNVGAMQNIANLQMQARTTRDPNQMRNIMVQIAQNQAQMVTVKEENQTIDIEASDDVAIRCKNPPVAFDEKGNVKKYTSAELKELKGDSKLPGYTADFDSLRPEQYVSVTLVKKKDAPKPKPGKENDADFLAENKPKASVVLILAEPVAK